MDSNSFWKEVIAIARLNKPDPQPVEQLSERRMAEIESSVFAHIEKQFPDDTVATVESGKATSVEPVGNGLLAQIKKLFQRPFTDGLTGAPALSFAMFALLCAGALTIMLTYNRQVDSYLDIPQSVTTAGLDQYIESPQNGTRALTAAQPSIRRSAFLTGITRADLDIAGESESEIAREIAIHFHQTTNNTAADSPEIALETVQAQVARFSSDENAGLWLKQGYAVEVTHLAAKRSLTDMNTGVLTDALAFFKKQAMHFSAENHVDLAPQYVKNHELLINAAATDITTPEQIQEIVTITHNMKVLIQ